MHAKFLLSAKLKCCSLATRICALALVEWGLCRRWNYIISSWSGDYTMTTSSKAGLQFCDSSFYRDRGHSRLHISLYRNDHSAIFVFWVYWTFTNIRNLSWRQIIFNSNEFGNHNIRFRVSLAIVQFSVCPCLPHFAYIYFPFSTEIPRPRRTERSFSPMKLCHPVQFTCYCHRYHPRKNVPYWRSLYTDP